MARITHVEPGLYVNMCNRDYHRAPGISKSGLDYIADNPSSYIWYLNAPRDNEKVKSLDMGTAIHCMLLEPDEYVHRFQIAPDVNRRTNEGKKKEQEFIEMCQTEGVTPLTHEEGRKLEIMRDSVMAHPMARWLLEQESFRECSLFAEDEETGELLKVRPDDKLNLYPFLVDVKKVDQFDRIAAKVEELRYHVQAAMYSYVFYLIYGVWPKFYFLLVGSTISAGKYPVDVVELEPDWMEVGHELFRRDLNVYHYCKSNDSWLHVRKLNRPGWAKRKTA